MSNYIKRHKGFGYEIIRTFDGLSVGSIASEADATQVTKMLDAETDPLHDELDTLRKQLDEQAARIAELETDIANLEGEKAQADKDLGYIKKAITTCILRVGFVHTAVLKEWERVLDGLKPRNDDWEKLVNTREEAKPIFSYKQKVQGKHGREKGRVGTVAHVQREAANVFYVVVFDGEEFESLVFHETGLAPVKEAPKTKK